MSIGDVAIAPSDANVVWVGTGENNNRQSTSWGTGVYKSTDGGHTGSAPAWPTRAYRPHHRRPGRSRRRLRGGARTSLRPEQGARRLQDDGRRRHVGERPVRRRRHRRHRTGDGSCQRQGAVHGNLSAAALVVGLQRRRARERDLQATDAGRSWTKLTNGIPSGPLGRIGLDIFRGNPNILYARVEHRAESGIYRSDDAGATWRKVSSQNPRPMYFSQIRIDPVEANRIYVLGTWLLISDDAAGRFVR